MFYPHNRLVLILSCLPIVLSCLYADVRQFFISSSTATRRRLVDVGVRDGGAADEARQKGQARTVLHLGRRFQPVSLCSSCSCHDIFRIMMRIPMQENVFFVFFFTMAGRYPYGRADFVQKVFQLQCFGPQRKYHTVHEYHTPIYDSMVFKV